MTLGRILKRLDVGEQVKIATEQSEYHGAVVDHSSRELTKDPVEPWFDPGFVKVDIELDEATVERLNLERDTLRVSCRHHDGTFVWKTPVAALHHDEREKRDLGDITDIQTVEE